MTTDRGEAPQDDLEPGVRLVARVVSLVYLAGPLLTRIGGARLGLRLSLADYLAITMAGPVAVAGLAWLTPWGNGRGRRILALGLAVACLSMLWEKYALLAWLVEPAQRPLGFVLMQLRLWLPSNVVVLLAAWQFGWRAGLGVAVGLSALDGALNLALMGPRNELQGLAIGLFALRTTEAISMAALTGWLLRRQRDQRTALSDANERLAQYAATTEQLAISRERNRLARELHDTLAHSLSAVSVQLEGVQALWDGEAPRARTMLQSALQNTRSGLTESRRALKALRASPLEEDGLPVAVGNLARATAATGPLALDLRVEPCRVGLHPQQEQLLYRSAQEALANVLQHAGATSVRVRLGCEAGVCTLTVVDDGQGFDLAGVDAEAHFGLRGMRERAEMLGALLRIDSEPGRGTTVQLSVAPEGTR